MKFSEKRRSEEIYEVALHIYVPECGRATVCMCAWSRSDQKRLGCNNAGEVKHNI